MPTVSCIDPDTRLTVSLCGPPAPTWNRACSFLKGVVFGLGPLGPVAAEEHRYYCPATKRNMAAFETRIVGAAIGTHLGLLCPLMRFCSLAKQRFAFGKLDFAQTGLRL